MLKGFPVGCVAETILPIELHREGGNTVDQPQLLHGYGRTTLEGRLTIALKRRKFSNTTSVPKNWWKRLTKIQKSELFSFPALQERVAAAVLLEFMKNMQTMRCLLNQIPLIEIAQRTETKEERLIYDEIIRRVAAYNQLWN